MLWVFSSNFKIVNVGTDIIVLIVALPHPRQHSQPALAYVCIYLPRTTLAAVHYGVCTERGSVWRWIKIDAAWELTYIVTAAFPIYFYIPLCSLKSLHIH